MVARLEERYIKILRLVSYGRVTVLGGLAVLAQSEASDSD